MTSRFLKSTKITSALAGNVTVKEHVFSFPLDWQQQQQADTTAATDRDTDTALSTAAAENIEVFVREVSASSASSSDPALLFLQGGPGFPSPRPTSPVSGWMKVALEKGHRVLLMDQRGTGASSAMSAQRLAQLKARGGVELQAHYLSHMRSDAIADDVDVG